jgi:RAD51-like protein 1|tara:strand:+ start:72 stop:1313 length:1242 start_codon:yes stop_codon:yes gene_type:complete
MRYLFLDSFFIQIKPPMSSRNLRQSQLPQQVVAALSRQQIKTCGDLLSLGRLRIAQLLPHLDMSAIDNLIQIVSGVVAPSPQTAQQMHARLLNLNTAVLTGLPELDTALGQGIPSDIVTELVGRAGVGKTQTCFTLSVNACLPKILTVTELELEAGTVAYLDTERKFSPVRVLQIAEARLRAADPTASETRIKEVAQSVVSKIHVFTLTNCRDLLERIKTLQSFIIQQHVRLIVVDSVAAVARQDFAVGSLIQRQQWLNHLASELKYLAETFHVPIVVTNQVTTKSGGLQNAPKLKHQGREQSMVVGEEVQEVNNVDSSADYLAGAVVDPAPADVDRGYLAHASTSVLQAALGNTWAHGVNTRLFVDVETVPGTNHGGNRCIRITKSPTAPYTSVPFQLNEFGISPLISAETS